MNAYKYIYNIDCVNGFKVVYQRLIAMYDSGCQICCNWTRLKPGFMYQHTKVPCRR